MPRKPPPGKSLAEVNPELAKEWHPTKNGELTPYDVSKGVKLNVWWQCNNYTNHVWSARIDSRGSGRGCPKCTFTNIPKEQSLGALYPLISKEWHPTKNENLTPFNVKPYSNKKVWWQCDKEDDHEYEMSIVKRTGRNYKCPICNGSKVVQSNSLLSIHPDIAEEWHPIKNGNLSASEVTASSNKKVWWKCAKGSDHEWQMSVDARTGRGNGCTICSNRKVVHSNCLATTHPELAKEWHPSKNGELNPQNLVAGASKKVWWQCIHDKNHIWQATLNNRSSKNNACPFCTGRNATVETSLGALYPEMAKEWHPTKNNKLTPYDVKPKSGKLIWWKCDKGDDHMWKARVYSRINGNGCPGCGNKVVVLSNSLSTMNPDIAKQWHPIKNGNLKPTEVHNGSAQKVWWTCEKGVDHEWISSITRRTRSKHKCPFCKLTPQSRQELTITFELLTIFKGINPKGFKKRIDGTLYSIDIYIPKINIGIEFDGSYWHKDNQVKDKQKTLNIEETGLNLIRVRQKPLERLFEDDVMAEKKFDGKQITNDILKQIVKDNGKYVYKLDKRTLNKIDKYIYQEGLQNEKGLDKYIDQILTEKAERKK